MQRIPNILHTIWFGPIPDKYKHSLKELAQTNVDQYKVKLTTDPSTMTEAEFIELKKFCDENKIILSDISKDTNLVNADLIQSELKNAQSSHHKKIHYARASDIARVSLLLKEGGIYTDLDFIIKKSLPQLSAKHGILFKTFGEKDLYFNFFKTKVNAIPFFFNYILYDFIASQPNHPLLKIAAEIIRLDYQTYLASKNRAWENSENKEILTVGTIKLTGTALKYALNYLHQTKQLPFENASELFFNSHEILEATYDKSWLADVKDSPNIFQFQEFVSLNYFLKEIDTEREKILKVKDFGEHPGLSEENSCQSQDGFSKSYAKELLEYFHRDNQKSLTLPQFVFRSSPSITLPEFKYKVPTIKFELPKLTPVSQPLTRELIINTYNKNGGSLLKQFTLFHLNKDKTPSELIEVLKERVKNKKETTGASSKTLLELNTKRVISFHNPP